MARPQDNNETPGLGLQTLADITSRLADLETQETNMTTHWKTLLALRAFEDVEVKTKRDQEDVMWNERFEQRDREEDVSVSCFINLLYFDEDFVCRVAYLTD